MATFATAPYNRVTKWEGTMRGRKIAMLLEVLRKIMTIRVAFKI